MVSEYLPVLSKYFFPLANKRHFNSKIFVESVISNECLLLKEEWYRKSGKCSLTCDTKQIL